MSKKPRNAEGGSPSRTRRVRVHRPHGAEGRFPRGGVGLPKHTTPERGKVQGLGSLNLGWGRRGEVRGPAAAASARVRRGLRSRGVGGPEVLPPPPPPSPIVGLGFPCRHARRRFRFLSPSPLPFFFLSPPHTFLLFLQRPSFERHSPAPRPCAGPTAGSLPSPTAAFHPPRLLSRGPRRALSAVRWSARRACGERHRSGRSALGGARAKFAPGAPVRNLTTQRGAAVSALAALRAPPGAQRSPFPSGDRRGAQCLPPRPVPDRPRPGLDGAERPDGLFFFP